MSAYRIRFANPSDAASIAQHRVAMFKAMGELEDTHAQTVESATRELLVQQLASGGYTGWLVEDANGHVVAGAGVLLHQYYPTQSNPRARPTAYILNVYTEPAHQRRGLAKRLIEEILFWCRTHDIPRASLHTSDAGKRVYESLGFAPTNEMRTDLVTD